MRTDVCLNLLHAPSTFLTSPRITDVMAQSSYLRRLLGLRRHGELIVRAGHVPHINPQRKAAIIVVFDLLRLAYRCTLPTTSSASISISASAMVLQQTDQRHDSATTTSPPRPRTRRVNAARHLQRQAAKGPKCGCRRAFRRPLPLRQCGGRSGCRRGRCLLYCLPDPTIRPFISEICVEWGDGRK